MVENTFSYLPSADILDDETTSYNYGEYYSEVLDRTEGIRKEVSSLCFFKYTFYIKNTSDIDSHVNLKFYINETKTEDSRIFITDTARFMIFENESDDSHNYGVYAKESIGRYNVDKNGNKTFREFISIKPNRTENGFVEDDKYPLVTDSFQSDSLGTCYIEYSKDGLKSKQQLRYTFVVWLEGEDSDSIRTDAPVGATMKLGVQIS